MFKSAMSSSTKALHRSMGHRLFIKCQVHFNACLFLKLGEINRLKIMLLKYQDIMWGHTLHWPTKVTREINALLKVKINKKMTTKKESNGSSDECHHQQIPLLPQTFIINFFSTDETVETSTSSCLLSTATKFLYSKAPPSWLPQKP